MKLVHFGKAYASLTVVAANRGERTERTNWIMKQSQRRTLLVGFLLAAILMGFSSSQATLLTYEGFPYLPTGASSIDGQGGGLGWDANWGQFLGGATSYVITNGSLSDPSGTLFTSSNRVYSTGGFAGRYFTEPITFYGTPGTTNYFSILIRPDSAPATNHYYGLQLFSNGFDTGSGHDVFVGKNGNSLSYGLEYSILDIAGATNLYFHTYSSTQATSNQTVFLVVRVVFATGNETFSLYVNPTPGSSEPVSPDATISVDIGDQNGIALNSGNGARVSFDEIRLGNTFASVTSTLSSPSDLLTYEPFAYNQSTVTTTLDGQPNDGTQASNGWDNVTWGQFLGNATNYTIASGSLSDPAGKLLTSGNRTQTITPATNNTFAGRFNKFTGYGANGTTAYFSFLMRPENLGASNGFFGLQLFNNTGQGDLLVGKNGSGANYGLQHGTTNAFSSVAAVSNQTVFLVVRADFTSGNDTFKLYVNPTPGGSEPITPDATFAYNIGTQNGLGLNAGNGVQVSFDEIRIGTNYTDVTPVMSGAFSIASIGKVGNSIVLTWLTTGGKINYVQATSGSNGSYASNGFVDISGPIIIPGSSVVTTNYTDVLGATNQPARYYRVRQP